MTMFDGLLDDNAPTTLTPREQADAHLEPDADVRTPVSAANSGDEAEMTTDRAPAPADLDPNEKLVIVEGQRFLVAAGIDNETVRQHQGQTVPTVGCDESFCTAALALTP
jgi:hypothetical protein